jgi:hypothetical protein
VNPFVILISCVVPVVFMAVPKLSVLRYMSLHGFSEMQMTLVFVLSISAWVFLVFTFEYYRTQSWIEVTISDEGISATWRSLRKNMFRNNIYFYSNRYYLWGKQVSKKIKWEDITIFKDFSYYPLSQTLGIGVLTKDKEYLMFSSYWLIKSPESYKNMSRDLDAHFVDACKKNLISEDADKIGNYPDS